MPHPLTRPLFQSPAGLFLRAIQFSLFGEGRWRWHTNGGSPGGKTFAKLCILAGALPFARNLYVHCITLAICPEKGRDPKSWQSINWPVSRLGLIGAAKKHCQQSDKPCGPSPLREKRVEITDWKDWLLHYLKFSVISTNIE